jgi:peptidylprolyl isomerase
VSNEKRRRQDQNRAQKQAEVVKAVAKDKRKSQFTRIGGIAAAAIAVIALLAFLNRGGNDSAASDTSVPVATEPVATTLPAVKPSGPAPSIVVPTGAKPSKLETKDLVVGTGPEVAVGDLVEVFYTGTSWELQKTFDENFTSDPPSPFTVTVGAGRVIKGWDEGLVGMKEGGRRQLIIPPDLAYGEESPTPAIAKNDTLIFVIEAARVTKAEGSASTSAPATTAPSTSAASASSTTAPAASTTTTAG